MLCGVISTPSLVVYIWLGFGHATWLISALIERGTDLRTEIHWDDYFTHVHAQALHHTDDGWRRSACRQLSVQGLYTCCYKHAQTQAVVHNNKKTDELALCLERKVHTQ